MTRNEAVAKAEANKGPAIDWTLAETAKSLVGKTLTSKQAGNSNEIEIVDSINGNYVVRINDDQYNVSPVAWVLQNLHRMNY